MNCRKFLRILIFCLMMAVLQGCSDYGEKRIVKLVTIDKEYISLYYYDYSSEKTAYTVQKTKNNGIRSSMTELLSEHSYDLKLCQYAVCSEDVVKDEIKDVFLALTNSKFSPYISIIVGDTVNNCEKYIEYQAGNSPLYTYSINSDIICGIVEVPDKKEKILVNSGADYVKVAADNSFIIDLLSGKISEGVYIFEKNAEKYSANLEKLNVFYSVDNNTLVINVSGILREYKGMPAGTDYKDKFRKLIYEDIGAQINEIFYDNIVASALNISRYKELLNVNNTDIKIFLK